MNPVPSSYFSSVSEISHDTANQTSLCQSDSQYIDFDEKMVKAAFPHTPPKAFDLLHITDKAVICIEFKNQQSGRIDSEAIREKALEGLLALFVIDKNKHCNILPRNAKRFFIVIYQSPPTNRGYLARRSQAAPIQFGLEPYKKKSFYDEIITIPCQRNLISELNGKLGLNL